MTESTQQSWHPTAQEQAVCDSLPGGCPHGPEWIAALAGVRRMLKMMPA